MINDNSIWPNGMQTDEEGYAIFCPMGTNKVDIPKNSPHWPKGSKLVGQFVYDKNNKLVGFCDTKAMTTSTNNGEIIVMPYEEIDTDFDSISNGDIQIHAPKATVKKASWNGSVEKEDIPDVEYKYKGCKYASSDIKNVDENYLENDIVNGCWTELLSSLTNGQNMFQNCENLISFTSDLSSLSTGNAMFQNSSIVLFESDLSSLVYGYNMFNSCSNLSTFTSDLSSLTDGRCMFYGCKLDAPSVKNIIDTINNVSSETESPSLYLGMGCDNIQSDANLFAQEVGYSDMTTLLAALQNKGWTITAQYNGRPSTNYSLRKPESLPVYVKLVEVVPTEENEYYEYTSTDGSKFYSLDWFHETTGSTDGYTLYDSLETAIENLNIKQIEK